MGDSRDRQTRLGIRAAVAMSTVLVGLCGLCAGASATPPGKNGELLISSFLEQEDGNNASSVYKTTLAGKSTFLLKGSTAASFSEPAVSPNGKNIAYSLYPGYQLWLGPLGKPAKAKALTEADPDVNASEPVFSPDGKYIYFSEKFYLESGTSWYLKRYTIKTKKTKSYKLNAKLDYGLSDISPNGRLVAFGRGEDDHASQTFLLDTKTGKARKFKSKGPAMELNFSPDGKSVAYSAPVKEGFQVFTAKLNGKGVKRRSRGEAINYRPVWSPDGKQIAYTHGLDELKKIGIFNLKTGKTKYIATPGSYARVDQWLLKR